MHITKPFNAYKAHMKNTLFSGSSLNISFNPKGFKECWQIFDNRFLSEQLSTHVSAPFVSINIISKCHVVYLVTSGKGHQLTTKCTHSTWSKQKMFVSDHSIIAACPIKCHLWFSANITIILLRYNGENFPRKIKFDKVVFCSKVRLFLSFSYESKKRELDFHQRWLVRKK